MHIESLILPSFVAALFGIAARLKLGNLEGFRYQLIEGGLSAPIAGPASLVLPIVEIVAAIALVSTNWAGTIAATALLLIFFSIYLLQMHMAGYRETCGCLGTWWRTTPLQAISRNFVILSVLALQVVSFSPPLNPSDATLYVVPPALASLTVLLALLTVVYRSKPSLPRLASVKR